MPIKAVMCYMKIKYEALGLNGNIARGEAECYTVQWKILAGRNFGKFGDLLRIFQIFYLPIACII